MAYILNTKFKMRFTVKKIKYRNNDGFTIINAKINQIYRYKGDKPTSLDIRGNFPVCYEGDCYEADCIIKEDLRRGYFIDIEGNVSTVLPSTKKEIIKFIHKKTSGVGSALIEKAVDKIGLNIISVAVENPDELLKVSGMTSDKALKIHEAMLKEKNFEELVYFIQSVGITANIATKIYDELGNEALGSILKNPYRMCAVKDIPFAKADRIANSYGWYYDHPSRIKSAILAFLENEASRNGSLCVEREKLLDNINYFIEKQGYYKNCEEIPREQLEKYLEELKQHSHVSTYKSKKQNKTFVYKKFYFDIETSLAKNLKKINKQNDDQLYVPDMVIERALKEKGFTENQEKAVFRALQNNFSIVTGGPGTGKTHTINMIVRCQEIFNPDSVIVLAAPTGKASRRMSDLTGKKASTLHKLLGIFEDDGNNRKRIKADLLVIDEGSMLDAVLAHTLFKSINKECKIVVVGDVNQIEAVGVGALFKDIIDANAVPITVLDKVFRQGEGSSIITNSKKLLEQTEDAVKDIEFNKKDFTLTNRETVETIQATVVELMKRKIVNQKVNLDDVYVLTPTNEGLIGTRELNRSIQAVVNPRPDGFVVNDYLTFKIGDKVINTKNNSKLDVDNGDTGVITDIDIENSLVEVEIFGRDLVVQFGADDLANLDLAYAMTIHKSQGSEFDTIIMPLSMSHSFMLNTNLIYTAWTRAKKSCHMVGTSDLLIETCKNKEVKTNTRISCLSERLK